MKLCRQRSPIQQWLGKKNTDRIRRSRKTSSTTTDDNAGECYGGSPPTADDATRMRQFFVGGTSKRVHHKCTLKGGGNFVGRGGGLCIVHGAKRKQCKYPGCTKHVKKAGLCYTHGRICCDEKGEVQVLQALDLDARSK